MYLPEHFAATDPAEILPLVPTVSGHLARPNPILGSGGSDVLLIVPGHDAYVSPSWYPSKAEHGAVVPTWNYEVVHLRGRCIIHDDADWLRSLVTRLTDHHEADRPEPWQVTDAPSDFIDRQLRAIVGIEVEVTSIVAKRKLSQNRSAADRAGVIDALQAPWMS